MRKLRNISGAIVIFLIALAMGIYVGGRLSYAAEETKEMQWYPNFSGHVREKILSLKSDESAGWQVPTEWMLYQVHMAMIKGEKDIQFILTDKERKVLETSGYHLYVRAFDEEGALSWIEDIPPIREP